MTPIRIPLSILHPDDQQWLTDSLQVDLRAIGISAVVFRSDDETLKLLRERRAKRKAPAIQQEPDSTNYVPNTRHDLIPFQ